MSSSNLNILLIEDNYGDERLVREALSEQPSKSTLNVVRNGIEALEYLRKQDGHREAARPDIIFLDLNIPKKSGLEVLAEIKANQELKSIPVLMLTTSDSYREKQRCLELKADDYLRKPVDLDDFLLMIKTTTNHWRATKVAGH